MKSSRWLVGALVVLLAGCAGIGFWSGARHEFEQGLSLFQRGYYREAIPYFERATEMDPDFAQAYFYLGRSYVSLARWREALPPLRTAYRLAPEATKREVADVLIDALFAVALSDAKDRRFSSSASYLREILQLDPGADGAIRRALAAQAGEPEAQAVLRSLNLP
jgi:tetratricopeptide (TPR) repeat protein